MSGKKNIYTTLFSDTAAFVISNFASKILVFLLLPLYTSILTTEEYGIADLITNTVNVIYPILTLSIMEATLRFAFDENANKSEVLTNSLFIIGISEAIIILFTPFVKYMSSEMAEYWGWFSIIYLGFNCQQVLSQYTKGIGKTTIFAVSGVVQTITIIASNILCLLVFGMGLSGYLFSIVAGYFVACTYLILAGRVRLTCFHINKKLLLEMLRFSVPTIPTIVAWWISTSADKYIIIAYSGVAASGVYSVAYKIPSILTMFTSMFTSAWTLSAIQNVGRKEDSQVHTIVYRYFNIANILGCSILILLSQCISRILFGKDFYDAWHYVPLLLVAYVFSGLAGFMASSFRATKNTEGLFTSTIVGALLNIVLNFYFIKRFGNMGAAFTTMLGFAVTFYIRIYKIKKIVDIKIQLLRDSFAYLLLIVQAFLISLEMTNAYIIGLFVLIFILFLYKHELTQIINKVLYLSRKMKGRKT